MKNINLISLLFFLLTPVIGFAQSDCVDAIFICGNTDLYDLETSGFGIQEITYDNACNSEEHNSIWLKVKIKTGGTFGFVITPQSPNIDVDFDFWVFGPNVSCDNLRTAIRCSTTNPIQAGLTYNLTGMNGTETDVSEGPGSDGNSFVHWLDVLNNEVYYIAVDRPVGDSNFAINWTGTAILFSAPVIEELNNLTNCDLNSPIGTASFDLTQNTSSAIGNQSDLDATFYSSYNDAVNNTNPILNTLDFQNTTNPQTIYIRVTNTITHCFAIDNFIITEERNLIPVTDFLYKTPICIDENNSVPSVSTTFTYGGHFSSTPNGLDLNPETGYIDLNNSTTGNYNLIYTITENDTKCYIPKLSNFNLEVDDCMIPKGISPNNDGLNDFFDLEKLDVKLLKIFNRYGVNVYEKENYTKQWNGLSNSGKELPDGTYYYYIERNNKKAVTGWVFINRER